MSPKSESQKKAAEKYLKEKVDEFKVRVPKGKKEQIINHAKSIGKSLNSFVTDAIDEVMNKDKE